MISDEQRAHDLTILYMQNHTEHWKQDGELNKMGLMYQSVYTKILEILKNLK